MQDSFVGDIGDFGKYILLNKVHQCLRESEDGIRLGVNWFRTKPETYSYLCEEEGNKYRKCSESVYAKLKTLYDSRNVTIEAVREFGILPEDTIFYEECLPHRKEDSTDTRRSRGDWFKKSLERLHPAKVLYLDPDNGVRLDKQGLGRKHVWVEEIKQCYDQGKSVIVYNHRDRSRREEYGDKIKRIREGIVPPSHFQRLRFNKNSARDYLFFMQDKHKPSIEKAIAGLRESPFSFLFNPDRQGE